MEWLQFPGQAGRFDRRTTMVYVVKEEQFFTKNISDFFKHLWRKIQILCRIPGFLFRQAFLRRLVWLFIFWDAVSMIDTGNPRLHAYCLKTTVHFLADI